MTTVPDLSAPAPPSGSVRTAAGTQRDPRGSWIPTVRMITTRFMELRKRRGLMIALVVVNIGIPTVFLVVRLIAHAVAPHSYGPAGGYSIYTSLVAGVMYVFGFIVAATLGCAAGSIDLTEGMFRHLVVTGRSRLALYFARIPAGLAIVVPLVAIGFTVVCMVCVFAAPTQLNYDGVNLPAGMSRTAFVNWAGDHPTTALCNFPGPAPANLACGNGPSGPVHFVKGPPESAAQGQPTPAQLRAQAEANANMDYPDYARMFLYPSVSLMIESGLWIELEAVIGFVVGLGLGSLLGQRTIAVILMIVLEIVLTPIFSRAHIPHLINLQRAVVGLAMAHIEPNALPLAFGGGQNAVRSASILVPEATTVAVCVIVAWLVGWTILGAWRMMTRDA
jgi:hypothetical protein